MIQTTTVGSYPIPEWLAALPAEKQWLFVGWKCGWETTPNSQYAYFKNGNSYLTRTDNPKWIDADKQLIGYNAARTGGFQTSGELSYEHTYDVFMKIIGAHLSFLAKTARSLGLPREKLFAHTIAQGVDRYNMESQFNADSNPSPSFYGKPITSLRDNPSFMRCLAKARTELGATGYGIGEFVFGAKMYTFGFSGRNDRYEIESREFKEVKEKLLFQLTNFGDPYIRVVDSNYGNRGELLLSHEHQGIDLDLRWAEDVLASLVRVWKRPVEIHTTAENKPTLLRFDGSLDDADMSLGERLQFVANTARCTIWRDGTRWTATRDQARSAPEMQFDYRNLAAGGESVIGYAAHLPASNDGVEVEYVDQTTQAKKAYIRLNISTGGPVVGASVNPKKVKLPGCATMTQAENRAQLEARRLIYQRVTVRDTALADASSLGLGALVRWIDPNDFGGDDLQAGEVRGISDLQTAQSGLDAAMRTYSQIQGLSLFKYLGG